MPGLKSAYRNRLFRGVHAEALKRRLDHDALHDLCSNEFGVKSMGDLSDSQLLSLYRRWTGGKTLKRRARLPRKGEAAAKAVAGMVSGAEVEDLMAAFAESGMGKEGAAAFVRRQLHGRDQVRTRAEFVKVMSGLRAMARRKKEKTV